jgi:hypothetical protein
LIELIDIIEVEACKADAKGLAYKVVIGNSHLVKWLHGSGVEAGTGSTWCGQEQSDNTVCLQ